MQEARHGSQHLLFVLLGKRDRHQRLKEPEKCLQHVKKSRLQYSFIPGVFGNKNPINVFGLTARYRERIGRTVTFGGDKDVSSFYLCFFFLNHKQTLLLQTKE